MEDKSLKAALLMAGYVWFFSIDLATVTASSPQCSPSISSDVHLLLTTQRNRTGHWLTQVELQQGGGRGSALDANNAGRASVSFHQTQTSASCGGRPTMVTRATIAVPPLPPGPDYQLFPGLGYYKLNTAAVTWDRARDVCAQEGTHLAVINSQGEADVIAQLLARYSKFENATSNDYAYVGFHDHTVEGQFVTIFGDPLTKTGYSQWHSGEPNLSASNVEDCGLVHRDGRLADVVCNWLEPFVCEQEL